MKNKITALVSIIAFIGLIVVRALYCVGIQENVLNIALMCLVATFIIIMYIVRFINKDKSIAVLPERKDILSGMFAILSALALVADGVYRIFTISNLEKLYHDLIELNSQTLMSIIIVTRSLIGFVFAEVLIVLAMYYFTGKKKMSKDNILHFVPALWGCIRLFEFVYVDGYWATSVMRGLEIIGVIFLVFSLLSISKMCSVIYKSKSFVKFTTQSLICVPIMLTSSVFGFVDALRSTVKCNLISYIGEFCLAMFVFFVWKSSQSVELSDCDPNYNYRFRRAFDVTNVIVFLFACGSILFGLFFRYTCVVGDGMMNTIHDRDKLILRSFMYEPKNNDIVVVNPLDSLVKSRGEMIGKIKIIKRIIAVGGQTLRIDFDNQKVYVDGKEIDEPYRFTPMKIPTKDMIDKNIYYNIPERIPEGYVFVMGDNRNNSTDSRYAEIGLVPVEKILGKVVVRYFPWDERRVF